MELNNLKKNIVIITSGQPSLNPRLVKEADALAGDGYNVTVLYAYWNDWGTKHDKQLLSEKKWKAIRTGGDPEQKSLSYFISRLINKLGKYVIQKNRELPLFRQSCYSAKQLFFNKRS